MGWLLLRTESGSRITHSAALEGGSKLTWQQEELLALLRGSEDAQEENRQERQREGRKAGAHVL